MKQAARISEMLMGVIFLAAGVSKVWDPVLFFWDALPYGTVLKLGKESSFLAARGALLLGPLECGLGLALLAHWRSKVMLPLATSLLAFFFILTHSAWRQGYEANCGCFGTLLERGPGEAMVENALMLGLLLFAWRGMRSSARPAWGPGRYLVVGGTVLALGVAGVRFFPEADRLDGSDLQQGIQLEEVVIKGIDVDLGQGDYLVEIFSPTCRHCRKSVPKLNQLMDIPGVPKIIALTIYERNSWPVRDFVQRLRPEYAIATVSVKDFLRLSWQHEYPRLAYVRDGVVMAVWERHEFPGRDQLEGLLINSS